MTERDREAIALLEQQVEALEAFEDMAPDRLAATRHALTLARRGSAREHVGWMDAEGEVFRDNPATRAFVTKHVGPLRPLYAGSEGEGGGER